MKQDYTHKFQTTRQLVHVHGQFFLSYNKLPLLHSIMYPNDMEPKNDWAWSEMSLKLLDDGGEIPKSQGRG